MSNFARLWLVIILFLYPTVNSIHTLRHTCKLRLSPHRLGIDAQLRDAFNRPHAGLWWPQGSGAATERCKFDTITGNMSILVKIVWLDRKQPQETDLFGLWRQNVAAQQICLENLANICSLVEGNDGLLSSALLLIILMSC